jgi:hypothetical protein
MTLQRYEGGITGKREIPQTIIGISLFLELKMQQ